MASVGNSTTAVPRTFFANAQELTPIGTHHPSRHILFLSKTLNFEMLSGKSPKNLVIIGQQGQLLESNIMFRTARMLGVGGSVVATASVLAPRRGT